jgi:lysophospholipase L1-like esterase
MTIGLRTLRWIAALSLALNVAFAVLGISRHVRPRRPAVESREQARAGLFHELAAAPAIHRDVVMLGDSLTDRGEWWELLDRPVANRGVAADAVADVRARLADVAALSPRVVFVLIGVNDLLAGGSPETLASDHAALIAELRRLLPRARIVVESLLPIRDEIIADDEPLATPTVRRANALLLHAAAASGVEWLDLNRLLVDAGGELDPRYSSDGLHLTAAGYRVWASALRPYMP